MSISRNIIWGIIFAVVGLFGYRFRHELTPLIKAVFNNLYVSELDTTDVEAVSKFMDKYKKSLMQSEKYSRSEIERTVNNTQKLFKQEKLAVAVGYNLLGKLVGYMAADLKTDVCIFYYVSYTGPDFSKLYKSLLQNLEFVCKKRGLKTLIIPILTSQIYQEDIPFAHVDSPYQHQNIEESILKILQNLGYEPLQGWSKFKQGIKGLFLGSYQYDSAWSKNL